jgi:streptogramin lyase
MRIHRLLLAFFIAVALCLSVFVLPAGAWVANFVHYATPTVGSHPQGICAGPDGNVWFVEAQADKIGKITPAGAITEYPLAPGSRPIGICAGPDGALWFAESGTHKIGRATTTGAVTEYSLAAGSAPIGICAGPDGALWFTESSTNKIGRITTAGVVTEFSVPTENSNPQFICAGPDGNLWFTENWGDKIGRITTAGTITEYPITSISGPIDITAGPDGALWFTEFGSSKIGRITTAGAVTEYPTPTALAGPYGICHGPGGVMWVTESNAKSFARVRMDGTMTEHLICAGTGDTPAYFCTGPDGSLWWTEYGTTSYIGKGTTDSPFIFGITPDSGQRGATVNVTDLAGNNFGVGGAPTVKLTRDGQTDIAATNVNVVSDNKITCDFALPGNAAAGAWNVVVANGDGQSDTLFGGFEVTAPPVVSTWYLAEGCTQGGMETWVLVQNPGNTQVTVDLTFMTSAGQQAGPQGFPIAAGTRHSFNLSEYVTDWDVSTKVEANGSVICERAMYGNGRTWAHDSIGVTDSSKTWYLAEGCTQGGMETWVLVQNPEATDVTVSLTFMTSTGEQAGPQDFPIAAGTRHSFNLSEYVTDWDVSCRVNSEGGDVICERAMYGGGRTWAHDSIGVPVI